MTGDCVNFAAQSLDKQITRVKYLTRHALRIKHVAYPPALAIQLTFKLFF